MKKQKKLPRASISFRIEPSLLRHLDSQRNGETRTRLIEDAVKLYLSVDNSETLQQKSG